MVTKPNLVKLENVIPRSEWKMALSLINGVIEDVVKKLDLYFEEANETLVLVYLDLVKAGFIFSDYLIPSTKFKFEECARFVEYTPLTQIGWNFFKSLKCVKNKMQLLLIKTSVLAIYKGGESIKRTDPYVKVYIPTAYDVSVSPQSISTPDYLVDVLKMPVLSVS